MVPYVTCFVCLLYVKEHFTCLLKKLLTYVSVPVVTNSTKGWSSIYFLKLLSRKMPTQPIHFHRPDCTVYIPSWSGLDPIQLSWWDFSLDSILSVFLAWAGKNLAARLKSQPFSSASLLSQPAHQAPSPSLPAGPVDGRRHLPPNVTVLKKGQTWSRRHDIEIIWTKENS